MTLVPEGERVKQFRELFGETPELRSSGLRGLLSPNWKLVSVDPQAGYAQFFKNRSPYTQVNEYIRRAGDLDLPVIRKRELLGSEMVGATVEYQADGYAVMWVAFYNAGPTAPSQITLDYFVGKVDKSANFARFIYTPDDKYPSLFSAACASREELVDKYWVSSDTKRQAVDSDILFKDNQSEGDQLSYTVYDNRTGTWPIVKLGEIRQGKPISIPNSPFYFAFQIRDGLFRLTRKNTSNNTYLVMIAPGFDLTDKRDFNTKVRGPFRGVVEMLKKYPAVLAEVQGKKAL